jgi:hypothetical protein
VTNGVEGGVPLRVQLIVCKPVSVLVCVFVAFAVCAPVAAGVPVTVQLGVPTAVAASDAWAVGRAVQVALGDRVRLLVRVGISEMAGVGVKGAVCDPVAADDADGDGDALTLHVCMVDAVAYTEDLAALRTWMLTTCSCRHRQKPDPGMLTLR